MCDSKKYKIFYSFNTGTSCLSFDVIKAPSQAVSDLYLVSGSQSGKSSLNKINLTKISNFYESDADSLAKLRYVTLFHNGGVNRIRYCYIDGHLICASWSERGYVYLWNLDREIVALNDDDEFKKYVTCQELVKPVTVCSKHTTEGFAMNWSAQGILATGDNNGDVIITRRHESEFISDNDSYRRMHSGSVEDIVWCPSDDNMFVSCSGDKSIAVTDLRIGKTTQKIEGTHESDVNVIAWRPGVDCREILSGSDDKCAKLWDLRQTSRCISQYNHHRHHQGGAITSLCWANEHVFALASEDNTVTQWDLSIHEETPLFVHCGQKEVKEIAWSSVHQGILVSTGRGGFNVFMSAVL